MPTACACSRAIDSRRPGQTNRVITMGQRWGTEGLDAAHAQQLQELLHDVSKLQHIVVQQVEQSVADQVCTP